MMAETGAVSRPRRRGVRGVMDKLVVDSEAGAEAGAEAEPGFFGEAAVRLCARWRARRRAGRARRPDFVPEAPAAADGERGRGQEQGRGGSEGCGSSLPCIPSQGTARRRRQRCTGWEEGGGGNGCLAQAGGGGEKAPEAPSAAGGERGRGQEQGR